MSEMPRKRIGAKLIITLFTALWISMLIGNLIGEKFLEKTSDKSEPAALPSASVKLRPQHQEVAEMQKEIDEANSENGLKEPEPVITAAPVEEKSQEPAASPPAEENSDSSASEPKVSEEKPAESVAIVEPAPTPTAESPENDIRPTPENVTGPFSVHFSTHKDKAMAENLQAHLLEKDIEAHIVEKQTDEGIVYYLCSDDFSDRSEALKYRDMARGKGFTAELFSE